MEKTIENRIIDAATPLFSAYGFEYVLPPPQRDAL
ncbi:MAG: hypothetical protein K0Q87_2925 [Neobacillus sp.]|jgi:hypothetical protein|nr:hypothetical protein [Neobacillus sp.]